MIISPIARSSVRRLSSLRKGQVTQEVTSSETKKFPPLRCVDLHGNVYNADADSLDFRLMPLIVLCREIVGEKTDSARTNFVEELNIQYSKSSSLIKDITKYSIREWVEALYMSAILSRNNFTYVSSVIEQFAEPSNGRIYLSKLREGIKIFKNRDLRPNRLNDNMTGLILTDIAYRDLVFRAVEADRNGNK